MRTLLRNTVTGLYFQGPDKWTKDPERAFDSKFVDLALRQAEIWHLKDVELAFTWDDSEQISAMPLERAVLGYAASVVT